MIATVEVEPKCLRESRKLQVRLQLSNPTVNKQFFKISIKKV